jgi:hypothetical protein
MPRSSPDVENQGPNAGQCHISVSFIRRKFMLCTQSGTRRRESSQGIIFQISRVFGPNTTIRISTVRTVQPKKFLFLTLNPKAPKYGDTSSTYWKLYGSEAEIYDENLVDSLKDNTGSMVFLVRGDEYGRFRVYITSLTITLQNTLFSAIVAAFIIEIYRILLPNNDQNSVDCPPSTAVRINVVLFLSFYLSMISAIGCALLQQWCDEYRKFAYPRAAPHTRGRVRTYLLQGVKFFQMRRFMYGIHLLLHISVFLFFWALSDFFYAVNHHFGTVTRYSLVALLIAYVLLSISPLIFSNSPYNTPMTPPIRAAGIILRIVIRSPLWFPRWIRGQAYDLTGLLYYVGIHFDRPRLYAIEAEKRADKLEPYAMKWLFTDNDFSDSDMDKFLEGLPGYMSSNHTEKGRLDEYLTAEHIKSRIKEHFITCATSVELSDEASTARVSSCVKALLLIFQYSRKRKEDSLESDKLKKELNLQQTYIQGLIDDFQTLYGMDDPTITLRASCISALAVQGFLSQLDSPPNSGTTDSSQFPASLIPIHNFLFPNDNTVTVSQPGDRPTPSAMEMWMSLLHDGPLANLTRLAQDVRAREHAPPSSLSFCWKTLDILLTRLGSTDSEEYTRTQSDFDILHEDTRKYIHDEERGFRVMPLLEILNSVARGRRLLRVFSGHPKYHSRVDIVFGKEYLRNSDLLEAFAHCLPGFIANHSPDVCRDFMGKVVNRDNLWTSLQVNLWNTQRSDCPIPDKLRIFEDCCTVLDIALSVLEDSQKVDWRAPEFGSLSNHFESFITHCFQGAFMGRATSFRVGIIKARFCKALLAQFWDDIDREGTVSFRSQWDVASLARLICHLGLRDKEDADFWDSYVNGGHIGADFAAKALGMIDMAARDGPLLIFCQLVHLTATAVPLNQSGLERKDIEKVWELQVEAIESKRLPLNRASDVVWKAVGHLRELVNELRGKNIGKDRKILERLLRMIDKVFHLRSSSSIDPSESELLEGRLSFASSSTAVNGGPSSETRTSEGEDDFGRACKLFINSIKPLLTYSQSRVPIAFHLSTAQCK